MKLEPVSVALAAGLSAAAPALAQSQRIAPSDVRGIRNFGARRHARLAQTLEDLGGPHHRHQGRLP